MSKADTNLCERRDKLKASLKHAYTSAKIASKASHKNNKKYYDQRAKPRSFEVADFVYLFNKARKPGLSKTFHRVWTGTCQITTKISDLNYDIIRKNGRKQVVHRLKPVHGFHTKYRSQDQGTSARRAVIRSRARLVTKWRPLR